MSPKKIYYLSITSFSDVDLSILHHIALGSDIIYGVVIQKKNANYSSAELREYCANNKIAFEPYIFRYSLKDLRLIKSFYGIIKSIKRSNPDLIYIVSFDHIILAILSLLLDRNKTVIALHDVEFHSNAAHKTILELSRKITMRYFKYFQVFSLTQKKLFHNLYPHKRVSLLQLPLKDFGVGIQQESEKIRFLFFGNILPYKGADLLIEAFNSLSQEENLPSFELVIAGRCDSWEAEYRPLIKEKNRIREMIGYIKNEDIPDIFINSHYLILPYRDSTQSGPLKIALNYNVPVIASDIASFKEEITDDITGYLFKQSDIKSLEATLRKALLNHVSHHAELKKNQKDYVKSYYSSDSIKTQFKALYSDLM